MNATIKIFLRTCQQLNIDGTNTVFLRFTVKRKINLISLKIKVKEKDWNERTHQVKKTDKDYLSKNKFLKKYEQKARQIIENYFFADKPLNFTTFKKEFKNQNYNEIDFFKFANSEIEKGIYSSETIRTYKSQLSKLKKFKSKIDINEINFEFIQSYKKYMIEILKNEKNTFNKSLAMLRTFTYWAIDRKLIKDNPFENIKIRKYKGNREYLTTKELKKLLELYNKNDLKEGLKTTLKYFLFSCYSGLRFQDVKDLKHKNIKNGFVSVKMHKTKNIVNIPINKNIAIFLNTSKYENKKVFKVFTNQTTNKHLKELMKILNIEKKISFHCARHTFASSGIANDMPLIVLRDLLGHTDVKTTQVYAKVNKEQLIKEMERMD